VLVRRGSHPTGRLRAGRRGWGVARRSWPVPDPRRAAPRLRGVAARSAADPAPRPDRLAPRTVAGLRRRLRPPCAVAAHGPARGRVLASEQIGYPDADAEASRPGP